VELGNDAMFKRLNCSDRGLFNKKMLTCCIVMLFGIQQHVLGCNLTPVVSGVRPEYKSAVYAAVTVTLSLA
jgi:hypothetical protein